MTDHGERSGFAPSSGYDRHGGSGLGEVEGQVLGDASAQVTASGSAHQGEFVRQPISGHGGYGASAPIPGFDHHVGDGQLVPVEDMGHDSGYTLDYFQRPNFQGLMARISSARMSLEANEAPERTIVKLPYSHNVLVESNLAMAGIVEKMGRRLDALEVGQNDQARYIAKACLVVSGKGLVQNNGFGKTCCRATQAHIIALVENKFGIHISRSDLANSHPLYIGGQVSSQRKRGRDGEVNREPPLDKVIFRFVRYHAGSTYSQLLSWDAAHKTAQRKFKIFFDVKLSSADQLISKVGPTLVVCKLASILSIFL